jgi:hypothetical protein
MFKVLNNGPWAHSRNVVCCSLVPLLNILKYLIKIDVKENMSERILKFCNCILRNFAKFCRELYNQSQTLIYILKNDNKDVTPFARWQHLPLAQAGVFCSRSIFLGHLQNALAFAREKCCHLPLWLQMMLFHRHYQETLTKGEGPVPLISSLR